ASLSVLKNRDRLLDKKEAIQRIFSSKSTNDALDCTRNMDLDFNYLIMWIYQNAYKWAGTPSELSEMYRYIALANIHRSRIYKRQYWKLLKYYFYFLSAGVNFAKKTPYQTQNIDWPYWGRRKKPPAEAIEDFQRIAKRNNMSMNKFYREMLPYIKLIFKYNIGKAYSLMQEYSLREETVKELAGEEFEKYKVYRKEFWKPLKEKTTIQEKRRVKVKKAVTRKKTARKKKKTGKKSIKPITAIEPLLPEKSQVIKRIQDQTIEKETIKAEQKGVSVSETGKEEQDGKKKKTKKKGETALSSFFS
ncbi:MAG: hypothetical protein ACTSP4_04065, partial [Candidatus Hodarchaeales archaeon]